MGLRCILAACVGWGLLATSLRGQTSEAGNSTQARSTIQATGVGTVWLKPSILRLSVPIRVLSDSAWDATENLRNTRRAIEDRAMEMGATAESLQIFGFHCGPDAPMTLSAIRGEAGKPKFAAQCFVIVDFPLREGEDQEETLGLSQSQLDQLASLLPEEEAGRRSYSVSTLSNGLTSQQLERPLALFVAQVSPEDQGKAFKDALDSAMKQVLATCSAIGVEPSNIGITQSPNYSSIRQSHPLEVMLDNEQGNEAMGIYSDRVPYMVRVSVMGQFNPADMN